MDLLTTHFHFLRNRLVFFFLVTVVTIGFQGCYLTAGIEGDTEDDVGNGSDDNPDPSTTGSGQNDSNTDELETHSVVPDGTRSGTCVVFERDPNEESDPFIIIGGLSEYNVMEDWTIEAWVKLSATASGFQPVFYRGHVNEHRSSIFLFAAYPNGVPGGGFRDVDENIIEVKGDTPLSREQWHHLALVRTLTSLLLFVDGIMEAKTDAPTDVINLLSVIHVGKGALDKTKEYGFFKGSIDDIRLSSTARYHTDFTVDQYLSVDQHNAGLWNWEPWESDDLRPYPSHSYVTGQFGVEREPCN